MTRSILNYMARLWEQSSQSNLPVKIANIYIYIYIYVCMYKWLYKFVNAYNGYKPDLLMSVMSVSSFGMTLKRASYCLLTT